MAIFDNKSGGFGPNFENEEKMQKKNKNYHFWDQKSSLMGQKFTTFRVKNLG